MLSSDELHDILLRLRLHNWRVEKFFAVFEVTTAQKIPMVFP